MKMRYQEIEENLQKVRARIKQAATEAGRDSAEITLIVVTKNFPATDVEILYQLGERNFGENRDQEGREKSQLLPEDCVWHFQGQIQSKKLRSITGWANLIHSIDDLSHAEKISSFNLAQALPIFIQVSLDDPKSNEGRGGVPPSLLPKFLSELSQIAGLAPLGLMAVAPLRQDPHVAFSRLADIQRDVLRDHPGMTSLSSGMSGDFEVAIAHGATHIRIGSSILGSR